MQAAMVPTNSIKAYIIREDVEFLHDGHAEQHKEQAVLPQQQANYKLKNLFVINLFVDLLLLCLLEQLKIIPRQLPYFTITNQLAFNEYMELNDTVDLTCFAQKFILNINVYNFTVKIEK